MIITCRTKSAAPDAQIAAAYRGSRVAVLPSVHHSIDGTFHPWPELMGLTWMICAPCWPSMSVRWPG